jgi:hypothetical protein
MLATTHKSRCTYYGIAMHSAQRDPSRPNSLVSVRHVLLAAPSKRSTNSSLSLAWASADGINWSILSNDTNEKGIVEGRDHYCRLDEVRGARGSDYEYLQESAPETAKWIVEKDAVAMTSTVISVVVVQTGKTSGDFFGAVSGGAADIFSLPRGTMPTAFPRIVSFDLDAKGGSDAVSVMRALPTVIAAPRFARARSIQNSCSYIVSAATKRTKFSSCKVDGEVDEGEASMATVRVPDVNSRIFEAQARAQARAQAKMQAKMQAEMATMAAQVVAAKKEAVDVGTDLRAHLAAAAAIGTDLRAHLAAAAMVEAELRADLAAAIEAGAQNVFEERDGEDLFPDMTLNDIRRGNDITDAAIFG